MFSREVEEAEDEDLKRFHENALEKAKEMKTLYAAFVEGHSPGEVLDCSIEQEFLGSFYHRVHDREDEEFTDTRDEASSEGYSKAFLDWVMVHNLLHKNDLIEENEDGDLVLLSHGNPDDLIMSFPLSFFDAVEEDRIKTYDLRPIIRISSQDLCQVTIGVDVIFGMELEEIQFLSRFMGSMDPEFADTLYENIGTKKIVIELILVTIGERESATALEIFEALNSGAASNLDDRNSMVGMNLDLEYVKEGLKEMRKAGLIQKSGSKFQIGSKSFD